MNALIIVAIAICALCAAALAWRRGRGKLAIAIASCFFTLAILALFIHQIGQPPRCDFGDPGDLPKLPHPAGYVYVIQDTEFSKFYKIGRTVEPERRISDIRNILPGRSEIVAIIDTQDAPTLERQLHQRYTENRKRGEWFALTDAQVREICGI